MRLMIMMTRSTRNNSSPVGVIAAFVASLISLNLLNKCQDVWSFSSTTPLSRIPRNSFFLFSDTIGHNAENTFYPKSVTAKASKRNELSATKTEGGGSYQPGPRNKSYRSNNNITKTNYKYKDRNEQQERERKRRELQNKLNRARDSIQYYGQDKANDRVELPTAELRSGILPEIVHSYTAAVLQSSLPILLSPERDLDAVVKLFDPWQSRHVILAESRPVQERVLGLFAVLIHILTYIEEEFTLFNTDKRAMPYSKKKAVDQIRFVQSRLWKTSREILLDMVAATAVERENGEDRETLKGPHVLSPIAITALAKALRESSTKSRFSTDTSEGNPNYGSGVEEIKELIYLVHDARIAARKWEQDSAEDSICCSSDLDKALITAWNNYLSSLCDRALDTTNPSDTGLRTAALLVMQNDDDCIVDSNIVSYNTVMNVAARVGNETLVDNMWRDLTAKREEQKYGHLSLQPNSRTYNPRLMVTNSANKRLEILDKEIIPAAFHRQRQYANATDVDTYSVIDSFTIDMMIMPLLQANRKKVLFQLIDHWMALVHRQHDIRPDGKNQKEQKLNKTKVRRAFKNAMAAFFITLVQRNGDVRTAREIWNRYMVLNIDNNGENGNKGFEYKHGDAFVRVTNIVSPERRHYNILLDGYARLVDQVRERQARKMDRSPDTEESSTDEKVAKTSKFLEGAEKDENKKIWQVTASNDGGVEDVNTDATSTSEFYEEVQEKAIHDGQELFALMMAQQQQQNPRNKVGPDAYTKSTMIRLCRSGVEVQNLLQKTSDTTASAASKLNSDRAWLPRAVTRAAVITCGRLGDPSMACLIFDQFMFPDADSNIQKHLSNHRAFNVLLGALAAGAKLDNPKLDVMPTESTDDESLSFLLSNLHGLTCTEAIVCVLNVMTSKNSQTYCVAASGLQYAPIHERMRLSEITANTTTINQNQTTGVLPDPEQATPLALQIFFNATRDGIQADGRLVNAIFRCYGDDIVGALDGWKTHIRRATSDYQDSSRTSNPSSSNNKNMLAAYNGLMYVCGRAERPDIAVRVVYAMKNKEGLDPSENPYNNYRSGKNTRKSIVSRDKEVSSWRGILPKIDMVGQYENILYVECKKYDTRDRRMEKDNRIRIIV